MRIGERFPVGVVVGSAVLVFAVMTVPSVEASAAVTPRSAGDPLAPGTFTVSTQAGPVGTVVDLSGNVGTGCPPGTANRPSVSFVTAGTTPSVDILYLATQPTGTWSAQFVIPSYLRPYNAEPPAPVSPGAYKFGVHNCVGPTTATVPFTVTPGTALTPSTVVGMAPTPDGHGYWLATADGGVYSFGDAAFHGSLPAGPGGLGVTPSAPIVGIAATPGGGGYWLVGADGGVFAFGDATFCGSLPSIGVSPVASITSIAATPDGAGYWLGGEDGGVFAFGDATFAGTGRMIDPKVDLVSLHDGGYAVVSSIGEVSSDPSGPTYGLFQPLEASITGAAATSDGGGLWEAGADGSVFSIGDATFHGSLAAGPGGLGVTPAAPIVGIAATSDGGGYWLVGADGGVFALGDAEFYGSAA